MKSVRLEIGANLFHAALKLREGNDLTLLSKTPAATREEGLASSVARFGVQATKFRK